ncbi:Inhibitor I29 domain containing protein, partial [Asbolus verrucosus]
MATEKVTFTDEEISQKWAEYKAKFDKKYDDETEENSRKELFVKNLLRIEEHNEKYKQGLVTFTMGINQFSDLTKEEMKKFTCGEQFGKQYENEKEEKFGKMVFSRRIKRIEEHNTQYKQGLIKSEMAINQY